MAVDEQVFNTFQIITYSLIGVCLFVIVVLCALVAYLFVRLHRLERVAKPQKHAFHNEGIQPEEELAKRGFSIYKGPGKVDAVTEGDTDQTGTQSSYGSQKPLQNPHANWQNSLNSLNSNY